MKTLAAADTISGVASVAATLTCTIWGMELAGTTETYKKLYQGQLAAAAATLYTAPGATTTFVRAINIVNTDAANARNFQLFSGGTANANVITPSTAIPPGGMAEYGEGGWRLYNSSGQVLTSIYATVPPEGNYGISGSKGETINRELCNETNTAIALSGTLALQAIWLTAGTVVNNISLFSATTAAGTPTNYRFSLYDLNRNLLAETANQTTAAWAANTIKTLPLVASYTVPTTGLYYIGFYMTATTMVTLKGQAARVASQLAGATPTLQGASSTGLTTTNPNPAAAITASAASFWASVT